MKCTTALVALVFLAGCGGTSLPASVSAEQLRALPRSLDLGGKTLVGETFLWRDMMPSTELGVRGLIVAFTVRASDKTALPTGLVCQKVSVVKGSEVWTTTAIEHRRDDTSFGAVVRNGPAWEVGSTVDVVAEFVDSAGNRYQLRAVGEVVVGAY